MRLRQKPYHLLLITGIALFVTSLVSLYSNNSIDIHFHDTYVIIAYTHIFLSLAILASFIWMLYILTNKKLYSDKLTWIHIIITTLSLVLIAILVLFNERFMDSAPRRYFDWNALNRYYFTTKYIGISIAIFLCSQIIFITNIITGLYKHKP